MANEIEAPMAFISRMRSQFQKPGQSLPDFAKELHALTPDDKRWFVEQFNREGMPTDFPKNA